MDDLKTLFLVDDEPTNLVAATNVLENSFHLFTFSSGQRLIKMLEKKVPDLILLDIEMPEMNGYDVIKILKSNPTTANIPVIFLTARSDSDSELEGLSLGAVDYIAKPFSPPLLLKRIEVHLLVESQTRELINFNENLQNMVDAKTKTVVEMQNAIIKTMADIVEYRDDNIGGHLDRTQRFLGKLLAAMNQRGVYKNEIASWDTEMVIQSALLHDIGKVAIRDSILMKPGKLTDEEYDQMKEHTVIGESIINKTMERTPENTFLEYAGIFAVAHHEKWDGTGYPKGLKGDEIPLQGRIMAIIDVYDALISDRPYKKPFSKEESINIIKQGRGTHFDPRIVDLFLEVSDEF